MFFDSLVASELQKRFQLPLQIRPHNAMIDTNVADGQSTVSCWDAKNITRETASLSKKTPQKVSVGGDEAISHTIFVVFFLSVDEDCNSSHIWVPWSAFFEKSSVDDLSLLVPEVALWCDSQIFFIDPRRKLTSIFRLQVNLIFFDKMLLTLSSSIFHPNQCNVSMRLCWHLTVC